jgi:23S rRNA pseudouridine1911/1915/1917 synthase
VAAAETALVPGRQLVWHRPPWAEEAVPLDFAVVYEDEALLVVSKPSGLPTVPNGDFVEHTLMFQVHARDPDWAPLHRLGRGTSGLVVCARPGEARARLQAAWRSHEVEKRYLGLASGALAPQVIQARIGPVAHPLLGTVHAVSAAGKTAETHVEEVWPMGEATLAAVRIVTGRPHQIRIHLASVGAPLVGDPLYGPDGGPLPGLPGLPGDLGYLLHAWKVRFTHPLTGAGLEVVAPSPPALRATPR